ncbi:MAG: NADH:flavin oxidoreductase [Deltaproteobacteria bacterium SG8_13]|nr:MAG: NADH:flavin oxidoreductase [Deltaproteobacteria bacterium SG8_13]
MSILFEPITIGSLILPNRFVRSATWEGMAGDDGRCTDRLIELTVKLVEGGIGLIITSHSYVHRRGQAGPWQLGIYGDSLIPGLTRMTRAVHERSGKIVAQLAHAGLYADTQLTGRSPLAPSAVSDAGETVPEEMRAADIQQLVAAFAAAAARAKTAGFDGVQIHAAHGYLLSQFLSPRFNRRSDAYGGNVINRARIVLEVLAAVRQQVGPDYPVLIKMNTGDYLEGGLELTDALEVGVLLETAGIDAIELSGGTGASGKLRPVRAGIHREEQEAYFEAAAREFRKRVRVPLLLVGGVRSFSVADRIVSQNIADCISMSRPFIREPDLVNRWKSGDRSRSTCLSDNRCFVPIRNGEGVYCVSAKRR